MPKRKPSQRRMPEKTPQQPQDRLAELPAREAIREAPGKWPKSLCGGELRRQQARRRNPLHNKDLRLRTHPFPDSRLDRWASLATASSIVAAHSIRAISVSRSFSTSVRACWIVSMACCFFAALGACVVEGLKGGLAPLQRIGDLPQLVLLLLRQAPPGRVLLSLAAQVGGLPAIYLRLTQGLFGLHEFRLAPFEEVRLGPDAPLEGVDPDDGTLDRVLLVVQLRLAC